MKKIKQTIAKKFPYVLKINYICIHTRAYIHTYIHKYIHTYECVYV